MFLAGNRHSDPTADGAAGPVPRWPNCPAGIINEPWAIPMAPSRRQSPVHVRRWVPTPVWMGPIRPLIVSEIENFERKEWKILSHDHISPYLTGTCDVVIRRTSPSSRQRKPHRDRAISGPKRAARIAGSQELPRETLRDFGTRQVRVFAVRSSLSCLQCS